MRNAQAPAALQRQSDSPSHPHMMKPSLVGFALAAAKMSILYSQWLASLKASEGTAWGVVEWEGTVAFSTTGRASAIPETGAAKACCLHSSNRLKGQRCSLLCWLLGTVGMITTHTVQQLAFAEVRRDT